MDDIKIKADQLPPKPLPNLSVRSKDRLTDTIIRISSSVKLLENDGKPLNPERLEIIEEEAWNDIVNCRNEVEKTLKGPVNTYADWRYYFTVYLKKQIAILERIQNG